MIAGLLFLPGIPFSSSSGSGKLDSVSSFTETIIGIKRMKLHDYDTNIELYLEAEHVLLHLQKGRQ